MVKQFSRRIKHLILSGLTIGRKDCYTTPEMSMNVNKTYDIKLDYSSSRTNKGASVLPKVVNISTNRTSPSHSNIAIITISRKEETVLAK